MSKHFKKYALLLIAGVVICSVSCKKDSKGDGEGEVTDFIINAKNIIIDGNDNNVAVVKAIMFNKQYYEDEPIATGTYENGGFKLALPFTIDSSYLDEAFKLGGNWWYVNNPNVKVGEIYIFAYDEADNKIGWFVHAENRKMGANYVYADRSVTITETYFLSEYDYNKTITFDLSLKKGWNVVYSIEEVDDDYYYYNCTLTTKKPSGVTLKWSYHG